MTRNPACETPLAMLALAVKQTTEATGETIADQWGARLPAPTTGTDAKNKPADATQG